MHKARNNDRFSSAIAANSSQISVSGSSIHGFAVRT
jgi:hypothetical protein